MPKINVGNSKSLLVKYVVRIVLGTVMSIFVLTAAISYLVLKLDIDLNVLKYVGIAVCIVSAVIISFISTSGFKNNFLALSAISVMPLIAFCVINGCVNKSSALLILIKVVGIIAAAFVVSIIRSGRKAR